MRGLLLDTHVWLWFAEKNDAITPKIKSLIEQAADSGELFLAPISIWEVAMLTAHQKVTLTLPCLEWVEKSLKHMNMQLVPLSAKIAIESCYLPGLFHGDPADRLIVATARVEDLSLLTKDHKIQRYAATEMLNVIAL